MGKASQNNLHLLSLLFEQESKHFKKIVGSRHFASRNRADCKLKQPQAKCISKARTRPHFDIPARRFISFHEDYGIRYVYKNNPDPG